MIRYKKNAFTSELKNFEHDGDKNLLALLIRVIEIEINIKEPSAEVLKVFCVIINGKMIPNDLLAFTLVVDTDDVIISPVTSGGSGRDIFRIILVVAAVAALTAVMGPGAATLLGTTGGAVATGLAASAAAVGVSLLYDALVPPPDGKRKSVGSDSQMYSISAQSNEIRQYGYVPKVYGTHRMFPLIAANPYTVLQADSSGAMAQFLYVIYDFGLGPNNITDIRIGDTPINEYADVYYRLVDTKRPTLDGGVWDEPLYQGFSYYKKDVETDGAAVVFNEDKSPTLPESAYSAIRYASNDVDNDGQEIVLDFVCPGGLIGYASNGKKSTRSIDLEILFSKANEDNWHPFSLSQYVSDFRVIGGSAGAFEHFIICMRLKADFTVYYSLISTTFSWGANATESQLYGVRKGGTNIVAADGVPDGAALYHNLSRTFLGVVTHSTATAKPGFTRYYIDRPLSISIEMASIYRTWPLEPPEEKIDYIPHPIFYRLDQGSKFTITGQTSSALYASVAFKPRAIAAYKVKITRILSSSTYTYQTVDDLTLYGLSTRFDRKPILTTNRHTFLEVKIKATNQLSGTIQNLSAICSSVLDVWTGTAWVKQQTNNPAWVFADLLTGPINKKAIDKSRLDLVSLKTWADFCEEIPTSPPGFTFKAPRFGCNFVLDYDTTLQSVINQITSAAQAGLNIVDGKYGVLVDKLTTIPTQLFTPRNSWGFSSSRSYYDEIHAFKVRYVDPTSTWQENEVVVYADGYNKNTATIFEELSTFACTLYDQAWRFGRYMMAQSQLRKEQITINVDFESLVSTRGDFVQISQDVMKAGGRPARVKTVSGNRITIDDTLETIAVDYAYVYRNPIDGIKTSTLTVVNSETFDLDGDIPSIGDLIIIGEVGKVVIDCLIKSITTNSDLTATLSLVERAPEVYNAESSRTLPDYAPILTTDTTGVSAPSAVVDLMVIANTWRVVGRAYQYYITIDWDTPITGAVDAYEVYVNYGRGYDLLSVTKESTYEYIVNEKNLDIEHFFKVLAVSATGEKLSLTVVPTVSATPLLKITPPSNVTALYLNITGEVLQIDWPLIADIDTSEYLIRYYPGLNGTWETSIPLQRVDRSTNLASSQARTGTYLIKAVDFNNNESTLAAQAYTAIPELFGLNIITETNDFPDLTGNLVSVVKSGSGLLLQEKTFGDPSIHEYYPEGFYYYASLLDLGEIYTVRLQSRINAEGYTIEDLMSNWISLDLVEAMSAARFAEWDVETQVRYTNVYNTMSSWELLSLVDAISDGQEDNWSEWKKFTIGDFTGKIFQFRLRLISNLPSVTPRVFDGVIRADMPDRVESFNNIISSPSGTDVTFVPAFKGPGTSPSIQITMESSSQGDYFVLTNKSLSKFTITFYDKNDNAVSRQFDAFAKGYGRKSSEIV